MIISPNRIKEPNKARRHANPASVESNVALNMIPQVEGFDFHADFPIYTGRDGSKIRIFPHVFDSSRHIPRPEIRVKGYYLPGLSPSEVSLYFTRMYTDYSRHLWDFLVGRLWAMSNLQYRTMGTDSQRGRRKPVAAGSVCHVFKFPIPGALNLLKKEVGTEDLTGWQVTQHVMGPEGSFVFPSAFAHFRAIQYFYKPIYSVVAPALNAGKTPIRDKEAYAYPWKHIDMSYMAVCTPTNQCIALLDYADEHKMDTVTFTRFLVNWAYCMNKRLRRAKFKVTFRRGGLIYMYDMDSLLNDVGFDCRGLPTMNL